MKIYAYVTAHNPLARIHSLRKILKAYQAYDARITVFITVNYEAKDDIYTVHARLQDIDIPVRFNCATVPDLGYVLPWFSASLFAEDVRSKKAQYYIYQEDDMIFTKDNFDYYLFWYDFLKPLNLEPGFIRYESIGDCKVPFDNYHRWHLTKPTPDCLPTGAYQIKAIPVNSPVADLCVQFGNPYFGASILSQADAEAYIDSISFDINESFIKTGCRQWPIADRRSMGLCFEKLKPGQHHRRSVAVKKQDNFYVPLPGALILHNDTKYTSLLTTESNKLITTDTFLTL